LKTAYYHNCRIDSNQILHNTKDHQMLTVGGSNMAPTHPRWRTAAISKTVKSPYLRSRSTDFNEIWQGDANWALTGDSLIKFPLFENPRWRRPHLENHKNRDITQQLIDRISQNLAC